MGLRHSTVRSLTGESRMVQSTFTFLHLNPGSGFGVQVLAFRVSGLRSHSPA